MPDHGRTVLGLRAVDRDLVDDLAAGSRDDDVGGLNRAAVLAAVTATGAHPLHADGTVGEEPENVIAVIYDRRATPSRAYLDIRLKACREYAAERGWTVAAEHVDTGDDALHDRSRPGLDAALEDVSKAADEPTAVSPTTR